MVDYDCQRYCFLYFRDFRKQRQMQQPDKPVMSITVTSRHCPAKLGFSGQFRGILLTLIALDWSHEAGKRSNSRHAVTNGTAVELCVIYMTTLLQTG
jgi:hypothetical protein